MDIKTGWFLSIVVTILVILIYYNPDNYKFINNQQGYKPDQPIAFSHRVHAKDNAIPCLYCHFAAEESRHAGIPSANVCMNCHREIKKDSPEIQKIVKAIKTNTPIVWTKVNSVPDFVYFNHSIHINRNIKCEKCHGDVASMDKVYRANKLGMGWCISCHREYTHKVLKLEPGSQVLVDCSVCHY
ncbi:MAG: cytochrome C [Calditrichaeota bacterium]|nr:MAG: cytochrome C [Calditrichota bacterium]